ncbi:hypothetical protein SEA_VERITY_23 [Gordonia phage Verity]|uniref:Uncharacterized protein n=1 Tax=Gordonia phage Verity TaxID=2591211 RepID=A0A514DIR5_9CAUD|nr:hypothetical protein J1776_gp23 [Gordonia phage Verity]QDH93509.1 hypothetical protein SEA_VERITY_23 [Gordonia phage Verity]QPO16866.1 hypothetical protein SEA_DELREY21_23 [Gordonia phage Delrey21]QXN74149.1 hypothetical protein SEA_DOCTORFROGGO_23 [Gordonia phage DoctorFroggo]
MPTILVPEGQSFRDLASELVRAAGVHADEVKLVTGGKRRAFEVSDAVFAKWQAGEGDKGEVDQAESQGDQPTEPAGDAPIAVAGPDADDDGDGDKADTDGDEPGGVEVPDRNDSTEAWAHFMAGQYDDLDVDGMRRTDLIAEYDRRTAGA